MSALEQDIMAKFYQLDREAQQRVRLMIEQTLSQESTPTTLFDYETWAAEIEAVREQIKADHGGVYPPIDAVGLLRELRDGEDE